MTGGQHFKHAYHLYLVVMELKKFAQEQNLCKSKLYYDALIVQSERILIQAAYYAKSLSDEEIRDCVYNMEEEDAFNFYMCVCSLAKARGTMTRLWERTKNSEDNFRVLRFRSRMQRELLEKEIADLKEELNKVNNSNTFKIGKFIMFIPCRIKELITRKK
jgi:hypothetical protein